MSGLYCWSNSARFSGRIASRSAPLKLLWICGKFNGLPLWKMAELGIVLRPVPAGESARRSLAILIELKLMGSKYRPAPARITVLPSRVAVQANPIAGAKLAFGVLAGAR